jgi:hypothetical protein
LSKELKTVPGSLLSLCAVRTRVDHATTNSRDRTGATTTFVGNEWFPISQAMVAYDHARHAPLGDVINLGYWRW